MKFPQKSIYKLTNLKLKVKKKNTSIEIDDQLKNQNTVESNNEEILNDITIESLNLKMYLAPRNLPTTALTDMGKIVEDTL